LVWWCGRGSRAGWMMMARVLEVGGGGVCVAAWGGFAVCGGHTSRGGQVERCETGRMHWWVVAAAAARADGARTATAIKSGRACDRAGRQPLCCWLHARMHAAGPAALMGAVTYTRAGRSSVVERDADAAWVGGPGAQQRRGTKKAWAKWGKRGGGALVGHHRRRVGAGGHERAAPPDSLTRWVRLAARRTDGGGPAGRPGPACLRISHRPRAPTPQLHRSLARCCMRCTSTRLWQSVGGVCADLCIVFHTFF
jgi:hypothetical protein